jgi:alpha-L-fucosidase
MKDNVVIQDVLLEPEGMSDEKGLMSGSSERAAMMAWWREARFGCFVHWGVYSALGCVFRGRRGPFYSEHIQRSLEISMADYRTDAVEQFHPERFDADAWIALVKKAGMRYFIITAKHHDGFAMYDSAVSDYNVVKQTPWGRDPIAELKTACDKYGIQFGLYYSHAWDWGDEYAPGNDWDWRNPCGNKELYGGKEWHIVKPELLARVREKYVDAKCIPQIKELITRYDPAMLWFDTPMMLPNSENIRIMAAIRAFAPHVIVNSRLARGEGVVDAGDYVNTGDRAVEFFKRAGDWEAIPTTNESYGWSSFDKSHKTPAFMTRVICKAVSRGGNILMNIGPRGDGCIDDPDVAILEGIGAWLDLNGEAIYGCGACDLPVQAWGVATAKGTTLYLHVFDWLSVPLVVGGLCSDPETVTLITPEGPRDLTWNRISALDLAIVLTGSPVHEAASVIRLDFAEAPVFGGERLLSKHTANQLLAFDAQVYCGDKPGITGTGLSYGDGKANNYSINGWKTTEPSIAWTFRLNEPASFDVSLNYGMRRGGVYEVRCGAWSVERTASVDSAEVLPGFARGTIDPLGRLELPAGIHEITMRVKEGNASGAETMRPQELLLKPA